MNEALCSQTAPEGGLHNTEPNMKLIIVIIFFLLIGKNIAFIYMSINLSVNWLTSQLYKWSRRICVGIAIITIFLSLSCAHRELSFIFSYENDARQPIIIFNDLIVVCFFKFDPLARKCGEK